MGDDSSIKGKLVGYSSRIDDPRFDRYRKHSVLWPIIFSIIIASVAVAGFYLYGMFSDEMDNPQALYIGLGICGMFFLLGLYSAFGRKYGDDFEGKVSDKKIKIRKRNPKGTLDPREEITIFTVFVRDQYGRIHEISAEDDDTLYNYYNVSDKVQYHCKLRTYETYKFNIKIYFKNK